jgi:glycosyltransferase 2 family protein
VRLVLTVVAVAWISRTVRPGAALAELAAAPRWVFAVPAGLLFINAGLHSLRLVVLLGGLGVQARLRDAFSAIVQAQFAGLVLPRGGGDVVKVAWLARATGRLDAVLAALAVARLIEVVPWLCLLLYGLAWGLAARYPLLGTSAASFSVLFATGLVVAVVVARFGDRLAARLPMGRDPALRFARALRQLVAAPRALAIASLLVIPTAALNVLSVWLVLRGYGVAMPLPEAAAVVPAADTVISLPVTVAGLGLREGVFVTFLEPWGVPESRAVAAAFTRWTGELARAAVGGVLFVASGRLSLLPPAAATGGSEES